jgi:hypothetical protein
MCKKDDITKGETLAQPQGIYTRYGVWVLEIISWLENFQTQLNMTKMHMKDGR